MVRQTPNHGWDVPEANDEEYTEIIDDLFDDIDDSVALKGPITERPEAGRAGRIYISTDEDPIQMYFDDGNSWGGIKGDLSLPDNVAEVDANETITGQWTFTETIQGSISGSAGHASTAGLAEEANDAGSLGGDPPEVFTRKNSNERIDEDWNFQSAVTLEDGMTVDNGTIDLPTFDGSDPSSQPVGSMWFRYDQQPTG